VAAAVVFLAGKRLNERSAPASHALSLSVVAGAVWPMLILGLVEFAAVAMYVRAKDLRASAEGPEFWMTRVVASNAVPLR
jgi:hypothetical protein